MDTDGDGRVGKDEFTGPAEMFRGFDEDGDGVLTKEEVTGTRRQRERLRTDKRWIFERLDRDGDGDVDVDDEKIILERHDANGDGKLDEDEFFTFLLGEDNPVRHAQPPKEDAAAPAFDLRLVGAEDEEKTLSLETIVARGRPVVLVFGSYT